ncbi:unnamed protein product, partial [Phaeothamnion confervicola]
KRRVHSFRIPLSPSGQKFMGAVYFCIPIVFGYGVMRWSDRRSEENLKSAGVTPVAVSRGPWAGTIEHQNDELRRFPGLAQRTAPLPQHRPALVRLRLAQSLPAT